MACMTSAHLARTEIDNTSMLSNYQFLSPNKGRRKEVSAQREAQLVNTVAALSRTLERSEKDASSFIPASKHRQVSTIKNLLLSSVKGKH